MDLMNATPFEPYIETLGNGTNKFAKLISAALDKSLNDESKLPDLILTLNGMSG